MRRAVGSSSRAASGADDRRGHHRTITLLIGAAAALLLAACGGGGKSSPSSSSTAPATSQATPGSPTSAPSATSAPGTGTASSALTNTDLASVVIPAPDGYAPSTASDVTNGPISASDFDKLAGTSGAAAQFDFVRGYEATYDSASSSDSIDISLGVFGSSESAASFVSDAVQAILQGGADQAPAQSAFPSIPGAVEVDGTKVGSDGSFDHAVIATKGTTFMVLDYTTDHVSTAPAVFNAWVTKQYSRL